MIAEQVGESYKKSNESWEHKANSKFSYTASDTIALAGFGCGLKVEKNALVCKQGFTPLKAERQQSDVGGRVCPRAWPAFRVSHYRWESVRGPITISTERRIPPATLMLKTGCFKLNVRVLHRGRVFPSEHQWAST